MELSKHSTSTSWTTVQVQPEQDITAVSHYTEHIDGLAKTLLTGEYHDLEIKCGQETWLVHRFIICTKSRFFEKACQGEWKEARARSVTLQEEDPSLVKLLLVYAYSGNYKALFPTNRCRHSKVDIDERGGFCPTTYFLNADGAPMSYPAHRQGEICFGNDHIPTHAKTLVQHAELFAMGDRYDIKALMEAASAAFRSDFELMAGGLDFKILFPSVIKVYTQTPDSVRGLRDTVKAALRKSPFHHWLKEELFDELLKESDSFACDIVKILAGPVLAKRRDWSCLSHE